MAAVVVCGSDLLRCGSDAAEELGFVLTAGPAAASPSRWANADEAAFSLPADPDEGLSGKSLQDGGSRAAQSFWVEDLADLCEVVGEATCSVFCLLGNSER